MVHDDWDVVFDRFGTEASLSVAFNAFIDGENPQVDRHKVGDLVPAWDPTVVKASRDPADQPITS
jgi:hypothetical protein